VRGFRRVARIASNRQRTFLWSKQGPREALDDLWDLALQPLLEEYLAGVDADSRRTTLEELRSAFDAAG